MHINILALQIFYLKHRQLPAADQSRTAGELSGLPHWITAGSSLADTPEQEDGRFTVTTHLNLIYIYVTRKCLGVSLNKTFFLVSSDC